VGTEEDLKKIGGIPAGGKVGTHLFYTKGYLLEVTPAKRIEEDLLRRDFPIHAFAITYPEGKFFIPLRGREDLWEKRISLIEEKGFEKDPVRILRAFRRVGEGFRLDWRTALRITPFSHLFASSSPERVGKEMIKSGGDPPSMGIVSFPPEIPLPPFPRHGESDPPLRTSVQPMAPYPLSYLPSSP